MDSAALVIVILILIPVLYLFYFWANSAVLTDAEVKELAESQRFWDLSNYLSLNYATFQVNQEFKSALNKGGQFYNCDETLSNFPGIAAALLKGKKHEWVIFAFAKNKKVFCFYANKGFDNQSVGLNIDSEYFTKLAKNYSAEFVLQFHNHPNAVLASSPQDITSANYFGQLFTNNAMNYLAFVCGTGRFYQYGWWLTESFYNYNRYIEDILKVNGRSRSKNFELHKELKRKKYSKNLRLNNSSHNINMQLKEKNQAIASKPLIMKASEMNYMKEVLCHFKDDLKLYPRSNHIKVEEVETMVDGRKETMRKYFYSLSPKEFDIFGNLELLSHTEDHKSFIFWTNHFSIENIKQLVFIFHSIFGNDHNGKGEFDDFDFNEITQQSFWFGRMWTDYEKYKCAVMISYDNEGPKLDLCVKW